MSLHFSVLLLQLQARVNDTAIFQAASDLPKNFPVLLASRAIRCYYAKLKLITAIIKSTNKY